MSTRVPGFQYFFQFILHQFDLATLATSSIRVNGHYSRSFIIENLKGANAPLSMFI